MQPQKKDTNRFDKYEADATKDGHRHDNPDHPSHQNHQKRIQDAQDRLAELNLSEQGED